MEQLDETIDAACVVVPPAEHATVVDNCLSFGLHVLVEKPFGLDAEAMARLGAKASAGNRVLRVGYLERFHESARLAMSLVNRPALIHCTRISPELQDPGEDDVHVALDMMSHDIDHVLRMVGDEPVAVTTRFAPSAMKGRAMLGASLLFANGARAVLTAGRLGAHRRRRLRLFDERNWAMADLLDNTVLWQGEIMRQGNQNPLRSEIEDFIDAVRGRESAGASVSEAVVVLRTALAIASRDRGPRARS